jgi:hypothetical protein
MRQRWQLGVWMAAIGCGGSAGGDGVDATTTSASSSSSSSGAPSSTETTMSDFDSGVVDSTGATQGESTTTGGDAIDPCLASDPMDCAPGCTLVTAYPELDRPCGVDATPMGSRRFCASYGEPLANDYRSTYYATIEGQTWFTFANQPCVESLSASPLAWTECSGADGEPGFCACGCGQDECGWEADANLLNGCGYRSPCDVVDPNVGGGGYSEDHLCLLNVLQDRNAVELVVRPEGTGNEYRLYVDGETVQLLQREFPGICVGPLVDAWDPTQRCDLAPSSYFEDCLAARGDDQGLCMQIDNWFVGCADSPATCP